MTQKREYVCLEVDGRQANLVRWEPFHRRFKRVTVAFVALTLMTTLATYLGYHAGASSARNTRAEAQRAVFRSCIDRSDLRITVAIGLDELRRQAIQPDAGTNAQRDAFFVRTQGPIDRLLSEAAGRPVKSDPGSPLEEGTIERVRADATAGCTRQASRFDPNEPPG